MNKYSIGVTNKDIHSLNQQCRYKEKEIDNNINIKFRDKLKLDIYTLFLSFPVMQKWEQSMV